MRRAVRIICDPDIARQRSRGGDYLHLWPDLPDRPAGTAEARRIAEISAESLRLRASAVSESAHGYGRKAVKGMISCCPPGGVQYQKTGVSQPGAWITRRTGCGPA